VTVVFAIFLVLHGLIHMMGFAKAFRYAELPNLTQPISPAFGVLWAMAALLFLGAAVLFLAAPRWWWAVGAAAVVLSTIVIWPSWSDAKYGMVANVIVLVAVAFGFLAQGPLSLRAEYENDVDERLTRDSARELITNADVERLPAPVARYLRGVGVVGQRRVMNVRAKMHGRIRSAPNARWMPFTAEQYNFVEPPSRLFYMTASMFGIPAQGYHRYVDAAATMRVKAAALVPVADASGDLMTQAETVTMFNDMCLLAPATLVDSRIAWHATDSRTVRAVFTNAGHTISATLLFDEAGRLVNFVSDNRLQFSPGAEPRRTRWSTPISAYRAAAPPIMERGDARWSEEDGDFVYIELTLDDVAYNVTSR
jgi:hypothetical protein